MTDRTAGALAQVTALDEERRRYEAWLDQLDARRGTVPDHVLDRVHRDYEGRLRDVLGRLAEHAEMLRGVVDDRTREVALVRDEERQRRDERAEAELRALVGEYTPEQWSEISARGDAGLEELVARRVALEEELARLEEVHALAATGGTPQALPPAAAPASRAGLADAPPARPTATPATTARISGSVAAHGPPPPPSRPADAADGWEDDDVGLDDVGRRAGSAGAGTSGVDRRADRDAWLTSDATEGGAHVPSAGAPPAVTPASATPRGTDAVAAKTLRCAECGTMNYPTEWYCERCGGELAAL